MKISTLVILVVAVFILLPLARTIFLFQKSRDIASRAKAFERINPAAPLKIIFLGDSTAVGAGGQNINDSVAGRFGTAFPEAEILNFSTIGATISDLAAKFIPKNYPNIDLIIIQGGANDILRFTPFVSLEKDLRILLDKAKQSAPNVVVLHSGNIGLAPFFPRPIGWLYTLRTRKVRDLYIRLAKEKEVVYVDLFTGRKTDPFLLNPKKFYAEDFLHLSSEGYRVWYEKIRESMDKAGVDFGRTLRN